MLELLFTSCTAGAAGLMGYSVVSGLFRGEKRKVYSRLSRGAQEAQATLESEREQQQGPLQRLMLKLAAPFMPDSPQTQKGVRRKLCMAGIYNPNAAKIMIFSKVALLFGGAFLGMIVGEIIHQKMFGIALGGMIGYFLPKLWLAMAIRTNQKNIEIGLPDALDLMVICVESGLTIDATLQRVGQELQLGQPVLSRELGITHMESRIGVPRPEAFRNLGLRTGNPSVQALTAMLIQAERFGTSIATALRIQAESLRIKRQYMAEELAAKASVKMSFPLVLFVFPAVLIVLGGPMIIQFMESGL